MKGLKICILSVSQWHGYLIKTCVVFFFFFFLLSPFHFSPLSCWHYCHCVQCPHSVSPLCSEESNHEGIRERWNLQKPEEAGAGGKRDPTQRQKMQTQGACDAETLQKKRHRGSDRMRQLDFKEGRVRKGVAEKWKFTKKKGKCKNRKTTWWVERSLWPMEIE